MRAGLFPGQGILAGTVLEWLPEDDSLITEAQMTLGYPLRRRVKITARRKGALLATELAQPAILVASLRSWRDADAHFDFYAGHSLGEYSALVAADALSFTDALQIVSVRGEAMNAASKETPGSMVALLGMGIDAAREIAEQAGVQVANDNAPDQVVLAGSEKALEKAATLVSDAGARSVLLEVSGPFHTEGVASAAADLHKALDSVDIRQPNVPVISNVTGRPYGSPDEIRELLVTQLTHPVRWRESVEYLWSQGARDFVDFGPGKVVAGLATRITRSLKKKEVPVGA